MVQGSFAEMNMGTLGGFEEFRVAGEICGTRLVLLFFLFLKIRYCCEKLFYFLVDFFPLPQIKHTSFSLLTVSSFFDWEKGRLSCVECTPNHEIPLLPVVHLNTRNLNHVVSITY